MYLRDGGGDRDGDWREGRRGGGDRGLEVGVRWKEGGGGERR